MFRNILFLSVLALLLSSCGLDHVSTKARKEYIQKARVWYASDISRKNVFAGPQNQVSVPPEYEVSCRYIQPKGRVKGHNPKFKCRLSNGETVRVKYSTRECFGEIAATRLFWLLGFYADDVYPVQLKCIGCPEKNPRSPAKKEKRINITLTDAVIERNFPGSQIEEIPDQGWNWDELDLVDPKMGGSTKAEVDALKLLAVFVQHTDSKPSQQRIACLEKDIEKDGYRYHCKKPVLMIQDLGATFGMSDREVQSFSSMYLRGWKSKKIWNEFKEHELRKKGQNVCVGNLIPSRAGAFRDPVIHEEGRVFLANLLAQLTDAQIRDLFVVARADQTNEMKEENGKMVPVKVDDWVEAFKTKRREISDYHCN